MSRSFVFHILLAFAIGLAPVSGALHGLLFHSGTALAHDHSDCNGHGHGHARHKGHFGHIAQLWYQSDAELKSDPHSFLCYLCSLHLPGVQVWQADLDRLQPSARQTAVVADEITTSPARLIFAYESRGPPACS